MRGLQLQASLALAAIDVAAGGIDPGPAPPGSCSSALRDSSLNLTEVVWSGSENRGVYVGAPSLVRLPPAAGGGLLVSSNRFGSSVNFSGPAVGAALHHADAAGASFRAVDSVPNACDSTLFVLGNAVYFLGPASSSTHN